MLFVGRILVPVWRGATARAAKADHKEEKQKGRILTFLDDTFPSILPISILERIFTRFLDRQLRPVRVIAPNEPL